VTLKIITLLISVLIIGVSSHMLLLSTKKGITPGIKIFLIVVSMATLSVYFISFLLAPRGYEITDDHITIKRPFCEVCLSLKTIREISLVQENMLKDSVRIIGNHGLFGYYGRYQNDALGKYLLYATRMSGLVMIKTDEIYIITPDNPEQFVQVANGRCSPAKP